MKRAIFFKNRLNYSIKKLNKYLDLKLWTTKINILYT